MTVYVQQFVRDMILSVDTLSEILGFRIYADHLPQNCIYPAATMTQISPARTYTQAEQCNLTETSVTLTIYAETLQEILDIGEQVRLLFSGYKGTFGSYTVGGIFIEDETDDYAYGVYSKAFVLKIENFEKSPGVTPLHYLSDAILASGGASAPAFGALAIGVPNGPQTAAQYGWIELKDGTGESCWVPVWK